MSENYGAMMGGGALVAGALGRRYRDDADRTSDGSGGSRGTDSSRGTGSTGRTVREMGISAPMLAENSLAIERHYG